MEKFSDESVASAIRQISEVPDADAAFRAMLLERTQRRVRRVRYARYSVGAAALVLAYAAGMGTYAITGGAAGAGSAGRGTAVGDRALHEAIAAPNTAGRIPLATLNDPEALSLLLAEAPDDRKPAILRQAGDHYLAQGDIRAATACYQRLLALDKERVRSSIHENETWLLVALRRSGHVEDENENETI